MANTFSYAELFQQALDKQVVAQATSGWMEGNAGLVKYNGGNTVKIPKMTMDGLGDYSRSDGYAPGSVTLDYETMTMTQDRSRTFSIDAQDVDETNFVATATTVMSEFQRIHVIPEVDAYRYSKIASLAMTNGEVSGGYTPDKDTILSALRADIAKVQDIAGEIPLIISMPIPVKSMLEGSNELSKQLDVIDLVSADGSVNLKEKALDNCPLIGVPSSRMKTAYVFYDGKTTGQEAGGFLPIAAASVVINGVKYSAASVGTAGNGYSVTIVQGTGASVTTAGVVDASGNLTITLGTTSGSAPLSVKASDIAALVFTGEGAALIKAEAVSADTVQSAVSKTSLTGGAGSGSAAKTINWIICAQDAPIAISKTDNMRIFDPQTNQGANAWKMDYRKYHDLWIGTNALAKVFVNLQEAL